MDELTRFLWEYACQYRLEGCYDAVSQQNRAECERLAKRNRIKLEQLCSPEARKRLENFCDQLQDIHSEDMEAAFTCGLRLGLALRCNP